jgi:conjugal transfer pilus assembly protein TraK
VAASGVDADPLCGRLLQPAHALQVLDARDGVAIEAILSIKEPTRIRIEGAPITDVFGNIHSSSCGAGNAAATPAGIVTPAANPGGEIVLECDRDKGEIYIRPVGDSAKPVNLFISSAQATYTLVLRRSDTPADTIVIRDRSLRPNGAGTAGTGSPQSLQGIDSGPSGPSANHIRAMKAMLVAMASDRVPT